MYFYEIQEGTKTLYSRALNGDREIIIYTLVI